MGNKISVRDSNAIYMMRGIAILSVIAAHVNVLENTNILRASLTNGISYFGQLGVIIFLLTGGFLYHREKGDNCIYFQKKLRTLVVPWLVCSTITYVVSSLLSNKSSIAGYLRWISGSGTWYYYIVIYLLFLFVFKWIWENEGCLVICILLNGISLYLGESFLARLGYEGIYITPYLNIFNWIGFFALGILIRRKIGKLKIGNTTIIISTMATVFGIIGLQRFEINSYFSPYSYIFEIGGVCC